MKIMLFNKKASEEEELVSAEQKERLLEFEEGDDDTEQQQKRELNEDGYADRNKGTAAISRATAISSCALYSFCSVSMVLVNKSLASSFNHLIAVAKDGDEETTNLNNMLVVFQAIIATMAVSFSKKTGWVEYPNFDIKTALQWAPVNVMFCSMLFTGMASLQHNSVPMVTIFKNLTNIAVTAGDFYFFRTPVDALVIAAFGTMLGGAVFAARHDVTISAVGLFWMTMNCLTTAGYVLYMKFATKTIKLSKFGMVFYNNVLCAFILLPWTVMNGEMDTFLRAQSLHTFDYAWRNLFAGFIGFFLNFASLNCVANTGPTTYVIIGSLNKIPVAILGWYLFRAIITKETWFFIGVSLCGGFLYSYAKLRSAKLQERGRVETTPSMCSSSPPAKQ